MKHDGNAKSCLLEKEFLQVVCKCRHLTQTESAVGVAQTGDLTDAV